MSAMKRLSERLREASTASQRSADVKAANDEARAEYCRGEAAAFAAAARLAEIAEAGAS